MLLVRKTDDFEVTGDGISPNWNQTEWVPLTRVGPGTKTYQTLVKALYSPTGMYFLYDCEDEKIACTERKDNEHIYDEDVVEVFLWPGQDKLVYFEYELSPLCVELPLLVPNNNGNFMGWVPWSYEGDRLCRRATSVRGGNKGPQESITGWMAEFFIPFTLLSGLVNVPPTSGSQWRGNIYRLDYDVVPESHWALSPGTGTAYHDFEKYGTIEFE